MFTSTDPCRISASSAAPISPRVCSVSGQASTSASTSGSTWSVWSEATYEATPGTS